MYRKALNALEASNRFRERHIYKENLIDLASNDYLGLASNFEIFEKAVQEVKKAKQFGAKASALVNGYHPLHRAFETLLCEHNGFEDGIVLGSGFLANVSLLEALNRRGVLLLMDEEYHASGIVGAKLSQGEVKVFAHNDAQALKKLLQESRAQEVLIAVEGIYSMSGSRCAQEIFDLARAFDAYLIVDEAHSSGVIGENLLGIFDYYGIIPRKKDIKMGTLGKAYGSYGAYILASKEIISFLENRAKPIIYSTNLSLVDTAIAMQSFYYILEHKEMLKATIRKRQASIKKHFDHELDALIFPFKMRNSAQALAMREALIKEGYVVGAIRPPTVNEAILRIILREDVEHFIPKLQQCLDATA